MNVQPILDISVELCAFMKINEYPKVHSEEFNELMYLFDRLESALRGSGIIPRTGQWPQGAIVKSEGIQEMSNQKEELRSFTKERYDEIKKGADERGIKIITKWRKGLKNIKFEPIVLSKC